jgi:hypothetical protein
MGRRGVLSKQLLDQPQSERTGGPRQGSCPTPGGGPVSRLSMADREAEHG